MRHPSDVIVEGESLATLLAEHARILEAGYQGRPRRLAPPRTDLSDIDFRGRNLDSADFSNLCLRETVLAGASLRGASFQDADLHGADLSGAELGGAQLIRADLRESDLRFVTFKSGKALFADARLDGANLEGAMDNGDYLECATQLKGVEAMADSYRKTFTALLGALAFCAVTVFTTTDDKLVPNSLSSELPVLHISVPIAVFFHVTPAVLLGFFAYTEMMHREFLRALHALPAILRDGRRPDAAYSPWILRERARRTGRWRRIPNASDGRFSEKGLFLLAAWSAPLVILLFWFRFLPVHNPVSETFLLLVFAAAAIMARSNGAEIPGLPGRAQAKRAAAKILPTVLLLWTFSFAVTFLRIMPFFDANFSHRRVSEYSPPLDSKDAAPAGRGLDLRGRNLRYADAESALLAGGEFDRSDLTGASFQQALLREGKFYGTTFHDNNFSSADLAGAKFYGTELRETNFCYARLHNTIFEKTAIYHTDFSSADLTKARLKDVTIMDLDDEGDKQTSFVHANLSEAFMSNLNLSGLRAHEAQFRGAFLENSQFIRGLLGHADFSGAHLFETEFNGANLIGASFRGAYARSSHFGLASSKPGTPATTILTQADFSGTDLTDADFSDTVLMEVTFCNATLKGTTFRNTDLSSALGLQKDQLAQATLHDGVRFPGGGSDLASVGGAYWIGEKERCGKD